MCYTVTMFTTANFLGSVLKAFLLRELKMEELKVLFPSPYLENRQSDYA